MNNSISDLPWTVAVQQTGSVIATSPSHKSQPHWLCWKAREKEWQGPHMLYACVQSKSTCNPCNFATKVNTNAEALIWSGQLVLVVEDIWSASSFNLVLLCYLTTKAESRSHQTFWQKKFKTLIQESTMLWKGPNSVYAPRKIGQITFSCRKKMHIARKEDKLKYE
jgi:hypothetical protein